jgi:hypothetical protein
MHMSLGLCMSRGVAKQRGLGTLLLAFTLVGLGLGWAVQAAAQATEDPCIALGGTIKVVDSVVQCEVSTTVTRSGTFTLKETLRITAGGKITVPPVSPVAPGLTLEITGALIMDSTSAIVGDATTINRPGATINVTATGDIVLGIGSSITANAPLGGGSCPPVGPSR